MKNKIIIIILLAFVFFTSCEDENNKNLKKYQFENWQYTGFDNKWRRITFPESVITSLMRDTVIKAIYFGIPKIPNKLLDTAKWQYKATVNIDDDILKGKYELNLSGIVGMADIYFNGQYLTQSEDMFISQSVDVSKIIKKGKNSLLIKFKSYNDWLKYYSSQAKHKPILKGREFLRLPSYFTDDSLKFTFNPGGFQDNIYITRWEKAIIKNVNYKVILLKNESLAKLQATFTVESEDNRDATISISNKNKLITNKQIKLHKGINTFNIDFEIQKPILWWTHDLGEPHLYNFVSVLKIKKKTISKQISKFGIREISLDTSGHNFELRLNGLPVTLKIINYIRPNLIKEKMPKDSYKKIVSDFVIAGINMVHLDQNGLYESDNFYDWCDKKGILVWQDFMFPFKNIPPNKQYKLLLKKEAKQQVERIGRHTCLAFWSGQNFYSQYISKIPNATHKDSIYYLKSNTKFFKSDLKNIVKSYDTNAYYFDKMDFKNIVYIKDKLPEYPNILTFRSVIDPKQRFIGSKTIKFHSLPQSADDIISNQAKNYFKMQPKEITQQIYLSNLMKKEIFEKKLLDMRIRNFQGYMCGNYADFYPVISNSAVDFKGKWKGKMYAIKNVLSDILIDISSTNGWVKIAIKSDKLEDFNADCYFVLYDFNGKSFWRRNYLGTKIYKKSYTTYFEFNLSRELSIIKPNNAVFVMQMYSNQELIAEKTFVFVPSYELNLKQPIINKKFYRVDDGYVIELNTDYFAYGVYLHTEKDGILTDNYFNLIPGIPKKVKFLTSKNIYGIETAFKTIDFSMRTNKLLYNFNK